MSAAGKVGKITTALLVLMVYSALFIVFSVKTIYYYSDRYAWWGYVFLLSAGFIFIVYYCWMQRPHALWLILFLSLFLGYMPFDLEISRIGGLLTGEYENLSGLAEKIPSPVVGRLFDILFYPVLVFIVLSLVPHILKRDELS